MLLKKRFILLTCLFIALMTVISFTVFNMVSRIDTALKTTNDAQVITLSAFDHARVAQAEFQREIQEWKNILLRGTNPEDYDKYQKLFNEHDKNVILNLKDCRALLLDLGISTNLIDTIIAEHKKVTNIYRSTLDDFDKSSETGYITVDKAVRGIDRNLSSLFDKLPVAIKDDSQKNNASAINNTIQQVSTFQEFFTVIIAASLFTFIVFIYMLSRYIKNILGSDPLSILNISREILDGGLNVAIPASNKKSILFNIKLMQLKLKNMVVNLKDSSDLLSKYAAHLDKNTSKLDNFQKYNNDERLLIIKDINDVKDEINNISSNIESTVERFKL